LAQLRSSGNAATLIARVGFYFYQGEKEVAEAEAVVVIAIVFN
jgi:hypothetical protein